MHAKVHEGHNEEETMRGASLRELTQFFKDRDQNEGYAGLRRIADEDGTAVWTILKETEVATQLEKRAGERREEDGVDTAALGMELERLKAENEKLIDAAASPNKGTSCGCILS